VTPVQVAVIGEVDEMVDAGVHIPRKGGPDAV
jgi:hypothetical protein